MLILRSVDQISPVKSLTQLTDKFLSKITIIKIIFVEKRQNCWQFFSLNFYFLAFSHNNYYMLKNLPL